MFTPNGLSVIERQRSISARERGGAGLGQRGKDAEPARVGHRARQVRRADALHPALDDRVLDAEHFGDPGLESHGFSSRPGPAAGIVRTGLTTRPPDPKRQLELYN
jgi:hypothetical protein